VARRADHVARTVCGLVAFFEPEGVELVPQPQARGPWAPDMMHGRLLGGIAGWAIERDHAGAEGGAEPWHISRLTVDLFRNPPMEPVRVETELVRDGRRVRAADASLTIGGVEVARASALLLRPTEHPDGEVWGEPTWSVPLPDEVEARPGAGAGSWDMRPITGSGFGGLEQKRLWLRDRWDLIEGAAMSPFTRVAALADFANPFANSGSDGLQFINADITLLLRRYPASDWLGFEVASHLGERGIAVGQCTIFDVNGAIGHALVAGVANSRLRP
jgi:hypothetical protein